MRIGGLASAIVIGLLLVLALPARADAQSAFGLNRNERQQMLEIVADEARGKILAARLVA